jgi:hypothetical protein
VASLVVLLALGLFVLDVERRHDPFGQHTGPKAARGAART